MTVRLSAPAVKNWPLWLGLSLVLVSLLTIFAVFASSIDSSGRTAVPLMLAGVLLVVAAGLLGWLAAQAMRMYGRVRRHAELEAERASALEVAVQERTTDLLETNARLEREIIEHGEAEAKLRQAQKMEAIGQLTGGIAHDFNNMLTVVVGGIELARRKIDEPRDLARHLDRAMEGAERAVALTRRLLSFARAEPANARAVSLNELADGLSDLLERTLGEHIAIRLDLAETLWPVRIDRGQMENAILNLAVNARDAMPDGGTLVLRTANLPGDPDRVELCVADTGAGMSEEVRERALEPFFTTKAAGRGTGLGLSQIFGLVHAAEGELAIDSAPGDGTAIRLTLPAARDAEPSASRTAGRLEGPVSAPDCCTILVVEDDARVRRATVSALEELGHRTLACSDGGAALALLRGGTEVDLVVSDVVMPGLSGPKLAEALDRQGVDIPVLFVTGYAATDAGESLGRHDMLRKPFTLTQLAKAVSTALRPSISAPHPPESATAAATARPAAAGGAATA